MEKVMERRSEGFTLIELMIVVAIIGILAAVAVPQMNRYFARADSASLMATGALLNTELGVYMSSNGGTPPTTAADFATILNNAGKSAPKVTFFDTAADAGVKAKTATGTLAAGTTTKVIGDTDAATIGLRNGRAWAKLTYADEKFTVKVENSEVK